MICEEDEIVDNAAIKKFFEEIDVEKKELRSYPKLDHGIVHDNTSYKDVTADMIAFINSLV